MAVFCVWLGLVSRTAAVSYRHEPGRGGEGREVKQKVRERREVRKEGRGGREEGRGRGRGEGREGEERKVRKMRREKVARKGGKERDR